MLVLGRWCGGALGPCLTALGPALTALGPGLTGDTPALVPACPAGRTAATLPSRPLILPAVERITLAGTAVGAGSVIVAGGSPCVVVSPSFKGLEGGALGGCPWCCKLWETTVASSTVHAASTAAPAATWTGVGRVEMVFSGVQCTTSVCLRCGEI